MDNSILYISPKWAGFSLMAAAIPTGGSTLLGQTNVNADEIAGGYSLAGIYRNGPFYASAAYEALSNELNMGTAASLDGKANCVAQSPTQTTPIRCNYVDDDNTQWRVSLGLLDWHGFTLAGIYGEVDHLPGGQTFVRSGPGNLPEDSFVLPGGPDKVTQWQVVAGYKFGNNMFKGTYGQANYDGSYTYGADADPWLRQYANDLYDGDREAWTLGFDHYFSKRTTLYVLYTQVVDDQSDLPQFGPAGGGVMLPSAGAGRPGTLGIPSVRANDWSGFSIGLMHSF